MSLNVLVILEDFRKDQYVLKPIIEKMVEVIGHRPRVRVCQDPLLGGVGEALKWDRIVEIIDRYRGMTRVFLLLGDRDGETVRRAKLDTIERRAATELSGTNRVFLGEGAWQEIEVWVLAGLKDLPKDWVWTEVRAERNPKERYFLPYTERRGLSDAVYEGRDTLSREAATNYARIRQLCPEDVGRLEERLRAALGA